MKKIVITGCDGRLGKMLCREYSKQYEIIGLGRSNINLGSLTSIQETLNPIDFDLLINCAALTDVDYCETHPQEAFEVNSEAVEEIGEICTKKNVRCIHISTDYVFDGEKIGVYTENDIPNPISVYGKSKHQGEILLLKNSDKHLVVRLSWVYGEDRPSFIDWVLDTAIKQKLISVVCDKFSTPTNTKDISDLLQPLLFDIPISEIIHICNSGSCSWFEFGQFAVDCAISSSVPIKDRRLVAIKLTDMKEGFIAKRPVNSVLSNEKYIKLKTGVYPRYWKDAVNEYVKQVFVTNYRKGKYAKD